MFEKFAKFFGRDPVSCTGDPYSCFMDEYQGQTFGGGLLTVFKKEDLPHWCENVKMAFPRFKHDFELIGSCWTGDCFAVVNRGKDSEAVIMFSIGTDEILSTGRDFLSFFNDNVPKRSDNCLAGWQYKRWLKKTGKYVEYGYCVSYKVPPFLGGNNDLDNYEICDSDVYWSILGQILQKQLPDGTVINKFTIK